MKCEASLKGAFSGTCHREATVSRGSSRYCWQHDPEHLKRLRQDRWSKKRAAVTHEELAVDTILVSALRQPDGDIVDVKNLPQLTEEEQLARNALGSGFVQRLLSQPVKNRK